MAFLGGGGDTATTVLELAGLGQYTQGQRLIQRNWQDAANAQDEYSGSAARLSNVATGLATGGGLVATSALVMGRAFLTSAGNMEATRNGFATMLGSMDKAQAKIAELQEFAATTPFDFKESAKGAQQLLAMGVSAEQLIPTMKGVGSAVAAAGGTTEDFLGVLRAFGQIRTKGKIQGEELNQMAERGVPALRILQRELGLTQEQLQNIGNENISADVALPALLRGFGKDFGTALEDSSGSFNNAASNFGDALEQFQTVAGEAILPEATAAIKDLTTLVGLARDFAKEHPNIVKFGLAFAAIGGAISIPAAFLLKLRGNALMAAAAKKVLTTETIKDTAAERIKEGVALAEGKAIGGVGKSATETAAKLSALQRVKTFLSSPLTLAGRNFQIPAALRGAFGGRGIGGQIGSAGNARMMGLASTGGAMLAGGLGIGAGVGARNDLKALGHSEARAMVQGAATGIAAAGVAMFLPGGAVAVALGLGVRQLVNKLYSEPIERETSRGTGLDPEVEKKLSTMSNRERQAVYNKAAGEAFAKGDATTAEALRFQALSFGKRAKEDESRLPVAGRPAPPKPVRHLPDVEEAPRPRPRSYADWSANTNDAQRTAALNRVDDARQSGVFASLPGIIRGAISTPPAVNLAPRFIVPDRGDRDDYGQFQRSAPDRREVIQRGGEDQRIGAPAMPDFYQAFRSYNDRVAPRSGPSGAYEGAGYEIPGRGANGPSSPSGDQFGADWLNRAREVQRAATSGGYAGGGQPGYSVEGRRDGTRRYIIDVPRDEAYDVNARLKRHNTLNTNYGE